MGDNNGVVGGFEAGAGTAGGSTTTTGALPKLRLTLKMPSSQSLEALAPPASSAAGSAKKKVVRSTGGAGKGKPRAKSSTAGPSVGLPVQSAGDAAEAAPNHTGHPGREKKELGGQFCEQIDQLRRMRVFKTRKWLPASTTIRTISGVDLCLPMWSREGGFNHAEPNGSRRNSLEALAKPPPASSGMSYICPEVTCGKVFDAKEKLKRHQAVHRKKLQLKLPSLKLVQQQALARSEAPTSKLDSEL